MSDIADELLPLIGCRIVKVEVISICHILRLYFGDSMQMDIPGSWRYRTDRSTILGASDIDYYVDLDDEYLDKEDERFSKKVGSLVGKKILRINSRGGDIFVELTGGRFIDIFDLSSTGLAILVKT